MIVFARMLRDERGGPLLEYAFIFALFSLLCAWGFRQIAVSAGARYTTSTQAMPSVQEVPLPTKAPGS